MLLYKYLAKENAVRVLESAKLRFSQPSALNDPFELRPEYQPLQDAEQTKGELSDEKLRERADQSIEEFKHAFADIFAQFPEAEIDPDEVFAKVGPEAREVMGEIFGALNAGISRAMNDRLEKELGILCLSELRNDLAMWGHYNEHRGIAIGFDSENAFFDRRLHADDPFRHLEKITYLPERAKVQVLELDENSNGLLFTKLEHVWAYEAEWRMLLPLQHVDEVIADEPPICLFGFPSEAIKEVLIGCRASKALKESLLACLMQPRYAHVEIIQTELPEKGIELSCIPINRTE